MNTPRPVQASNLNQFVDIANASVYKSGAAQLIRETIGIEPRDLTFVIHAVRWSDGGEIVKQNWYVYHAGVWTDAQFGTGKRIYGCKQIWFLYLQFNARSPHTTYVIETKKKTAAYFDHAQAAAGLFGVSLTPTVGEARNIWNARLVEIPYVPSDVVITPPAGGSMTFDNEGLSWIDFSAAVPVKQAGVFAVVDLYFRPVDIKSSMGFGNWPHAVEGVRVANQPLKNILAGVGWGPVYAGVVMGGGTRAFSYGINIPIRAAMSALKK